MSTLVAIGFNSKHRAQEALHTLTKLEKDYLIDLEDAVIATRKENGKIKLKQSTNMVGMGAFQGAWWGSLIGLIFAGPLGMLIGGASTAGFGALAGSLADYGINDNFIKQLGETLQPGHSALFVLVKSATEDKVMAELEGTGGTIIKTSLSNEDEAKLKEALRPKEAV